MPLQIVRQDITKMRVDAIVKFGENISISVPFTKNACDTSVDNLGFSVRASNSLKRAGGIYNRGYNLFYMRGEKYELYRYCKQNKRISSCLH